MTATNPPSKRPLGFLAAIAMVALPALFYAWLYSGLLPPWSWKIALAFAPAALSLMSLIAFLARRSRAAGGLAILALGLLVLCISLDVAAVDRLEGI